MSEVSSAVEVIRSQLEILRGQCAVLSHRELIGLLSALTSVMWSVPAIEHQVLARLLTESDPARLGDASWPAVLTTALRVSHRHAKRQLREARNLGPRQAMTGQPLPPLWEATAAAQAQGLIGPEHVAVIAKFHNDLPSWVDIGTREAADRQLADLAGGLGPDQLDKVAQRLTAMIDQDGPEPSDQDHSRKRTLMLGRQQRDGMSRITGWLDPEARAIWDAVLAKMAAPGMGTPDTDAPTTDSASTDSGSADSAPGQCVLGDVRTQSQRNHDAFKAVGRLVLASGELGQHNGLPVTVIVSTTLQELESGAGVAVTGGGSTLPMPDLIRLASRAHHYLAVFDQHTNQALYLGRTKRCASAAQRIVLHARDRGCTRPGCIASGYQCQVHHAVADWKNDGQTDVNDLTLACGPDNRMIDKTGWRTRRNSRGRTEWLPPPDLDTGRTRINGYHHPERYLLPEDHQPPEDAEDGDP